jgi:hypothetical protein
MFLFPRSLMHMPDSATSRPRRRSRLRWIVAIAALLGFFFWLGANYPTPPQPLMCKVYG